MIYIILLYNYNQYFVGGKSAEIKLLKRNKLKEYSWDFGELLKDKFNKKREAHTSLFY